LFIVFTLNQSKIAEIIEVYKQMKFHEVIDYLFFHKVHENSFMYA